MSEAGADSNSTRPNTTTALVQLAVIDMIGLMIEHYSGMYAKTELTSRSHRPIRHFSPSLSDCITVKPVDCRRTCLVTQMASVHAIHWLSAVIRPLNLNASKIQPVDFCLISIHVTRIHVTSRNDHAHFSFCYPIIRQQTTYKLCNLGGPTGTHVFGDSIYTFPYNNRASVRMKTDLWFTGLYYGQV